MESVRGLVFIINRKYLLQEYCEQLIEMAVSFGVERIAFVDQTKDVLMKDVINIRPRVLDMHVCFSVHDAIELLGGTPVYFEEHQKPLVDFEPPAAPLYIFGPDRGGQAVPVGAIGVSIDTFRPGHLWSQQAAAIALHDFAAAVNGLRRGRK